MAVYRYRCPACGPFDAAWPIGNAPAGQACPACGDQARRVFTPPLVTRTPAALARALSAQEASAREPRIVRGVPPARRAPAAPDPRQARLPRP